MSDWLDSFSMMGATLNEGEKSLMRFAISKERNRILNAIQKIEEQSHKTRTPLFQDTLFEKVREAINE